MYQYAPSVGYTPASENISLEVVGPAGMVLDVDDANCGDLMPGHTSCTFYITEDGFYNVVLTESNEMDTRISPPYNFRSMFCTKHLTIIIRITLTSR